MPDSAFHYAQMEYDFAKASGLEAYMAEALNTQGVSLRKRGEYSKAMRYHKEGLAIFERTGKQGSVASALNNIGIIHRLQGNYPEALRSYLRSLRIKEELGDMKMISGALNNIGNLYFNQEDFTNALEYYHRSLTIREDMGDGRGAGEVLMNIGNIKFFQSDHHSALEYYQKSLAIHKELGDQRAYANLMNNLGKVYQAQGMYSDALDHYKRSLSTQEELGNDLGMAYSLNNIGRTYQEYGDHSKALEFCKKGHALSERLELLLQQKEACECLYQAYKDVDDHSQALEYHEQFKMLEDSLFNVSNVEELTRMEMRYEYDKAQLADSLQHAAELALVENERTIESLRADRNRNRAMATGGGALLLLAGGGAWFVTDRKRRKERFEKEAATLETQALRSQMNPHFIFNALNSINAFVQQNDPDNATSFLTKFARVMRSVLENSRHSEVPLQDDLETLRSYMELERKRMGGAFDFSIEVDPAIDPEEVMVPPLVVQPFVENAIWHGMKGRTDKGHITLRVKQQGEQLVWQIEDDGAGRQAKQEPSPAPASGQPGKKTSLGTAITRSRLDLVQKQHGGRAGFRYEDLQQGTRVIVEMPLLSA